METGLEERARYAKTWPAIRSGSKVGTEEAMPIGSCCSRLVGRIVLSNAHQSCSVKTRPTYAMMPAALPLVHQRKPQITSYFTMRLLYNCSSKSNHKHYK